VSLVSVFYDDIDLKPDWTGDWRCHRIIQSRYKDRGRGQAYNPTVSELHLVSDLHYSELVRYTTPSVDYTGQSTVLWLSDSEYTLTLSQSLTELVNIATLTVS